MIKAIMHGCNGKMGQVISKIVKDDPNAEMVAGIDKYMGIANEIFTLVSATVSVIILLKARKSRQQRIGNNTL